jgi:subtilisin family serine protease
MTFLGMLALTVAALGGHRPDSTRPSSSPDTGLSETSKILLPAVGNGGDLGLEAKEPPIAHPSRVLVRFKPGTTRAARQDAHAVAKSLHTLREYHAVSDLLLVEVPEGTVDEAVAAYRKNPNVLYAEPDCLICTDVIPNDPDFGLLWGLHNTGQTVYGDPGTPGADIRAVSAWDFWAGDPDFRVAVIDTGVDYTHPDLAANMWTNEAELNGQTGVDDDGNGYIDDIHGYDFYDDDGDPMDEYGHGTHVSGTIAGVANNDEGVAGVNWHCKIVALRFLTGG